MEVDDSLATAAHLAGDRWVLILTGLLAGGPRTFSELQVAGAAPNILTERLRRMTAAGLLHASPYSRRPPRMRYELTGYGRELAQLVEGLRSWGARRVGGPALVAHSACGTPLEIALWCRTCGVAVVPGASSSRAATPTNDLAGHSETGDTELYTL